MTFHEAMSSVAEGLCVRRAEWPLERFLRSEECDVSESEPEGWYVANHIEHPLGGSTFGTYHPIPEDEVATDWEVYPYG